MNNSVPLPKTGIKRYRVIIIIINRMEDIKIKCSKCQTEKSVGEMKKDSHYKNGVKKICKNCENERKKKIP